jgi:hypothetical protein
VTPGTVAQGEHTAVTDCDRIILTRWVFLGEVSTNMDVALALLSELSRRLREQENKLLL